MTSPEKDKRRRGAWHIIMYKLSTDEIKLEHNSHQSEVKAIQQEEISSDDS